MKKSELRSGMIVTMRNGELCLIVHKCDESKLVLLYLKSGGYDLLDIWTEDLLYCGNSGLDGKDAVSVSTKAGWGSWNMDFANTLWNRVDVKEMTVEQISKELGYDVKIVK